MSPQKREQENLLQRRPAESTAIAGGVAGAPLALILGTIFGFRTDPELIAAVGAVITFIVGAIPTIITWRVSRKQ